MTPLFPLWSDMFLGLVYVCSAFAAVWFCVMVGKGIAKALAR